MNGKDDGSVMVQVEDTPQSEMIRTYVKLQEGDIIEGDKHTSAGIAKALEKCVSHPHALITLVSNPPSLHYDVC